MQSVARRLRKKIKKVLLAVSPSVLINSWVESSLRRLHQTELASVEAIIEFQKSFTCDGLLGNISTKQNYVEYLAFLEYCKSLNPKRILEIGTYKGGTLFGWTRIASDDALIISVDLFPGLENSYTRFRQRLYEGMARASQVVRTFDQGSEDISTLEGVKSILDGEMLDILFIDGDHRYAAVARDFNLYKSFVRNGGIIVFHDILARPDVEHVQVDKFWSELKKDNGFQLIEFVGSESKPVGIGVARVL